MGHIELARWADVVVVAPATAHFMAQLAAGLAGDLLTHAMSRDDGADRAGSRDESSDVGERSRRRRTARCSSRAACVCSVRREGDQACGETGPGRMLEPTRDRDGAARDAGRAATVARGTQGARHGGADARADRSGALHHEPQLRARWDMRSRPPRAKRAPTSCSSAGPSRCRRRPACGESTSRPRTEMYDEGA